MQPVGMYDKICQAACENQHIVLLWSSLSDNILIQSKPDTMISGGKNQIIAKYIAVNVALQKWAPSTL